jgi:hypothetical protein
MRIAAIVFAILLAGLVAAFVRLRPSSEERKELANASALLRQKVLSREFLKGAPSGKAGAVRCVVMDWNIGSGVATLVAFDDGTTSIYLSSGGGVIGAGAHESVARVAGLFRQEAAKVMGRFTPAAEYPLPGREMTVFYVVTDSATLSSGPIANPDLRRDDHPLSALGRMAQDVITQVRKAS